MLTFISSEHAYFWQGKRVPNVTSIISPLTDYSRIPPDVLEKARQQGQEIHKMVELDCRGALDVDDLMKNGDLAWMRPHYLAWRKFLAETGFELWLSEERVYHSRYAYAGTLDLVGIMTKTKLRDPALLDIKRSFFGGRAIGVQTVAYAEARNASSPKDLRTTKRFGLRLGNTGEYRLMPFEDKDDFGVFLACLTLNRYAAKEKA